MNKISAYVLRWKLLTRVMTLLGFGSYAQSNKKDTDATGDSRNTVKRHAKQVYRPGAVMYGCQHTLFGRILNKLRN